MSGPAIVLVGPPGAGKTTVGRLLADRLGTDFRDTDEDVEEQAGKPIADIFIDSGEAHFRALERAAVARALAEHRGVLALGGGAVLDAGTQELLRGQTVVLLDVGMADAARRVGLARDRPVLTLNPRAQLHRLLGERRPLYLQVATAVVGTDGREPADVAADVLAAVGTR
ncbi:MAG: shikimate kinase [Mycobacteriales bacterium]